MSMLNYMYTDVQLCNRQHHCLCAHTTQCTLHVRGCSVSHKYQTKDASDHCLLCTDPYTVVQLYIIYNTIVYILQYGKLQLWQCKLKFPNQLQDAPFKSSCQVQEIWTSHSITYCVARETPFTQHKLGIPPSHRYITHQGIPFVMHTSCPVC